MFNEFVDRLSKRSEAARSESDFTYLYALLIEAEALYKLVALCLLACIEEDVDRHKYRVERGLVQADGIGSWGQFVDDLVVGKASSHLFASAQVFTADITLKVGVGCWQRDSVDHLLTAMSAVGIPGDEAQSGTGKTNLLQWFRLFPQLRNATRGHGATQPGVASQIAVPLAASLALIKSNVRVFAIPWVYLHRFLNGKYRLTPISSPNSPDSQPPEPSANYEPGVYVQVGALRHVPLVRSDADLSDFYLPNGSFNGARFELLSYITDDKEAGDAKPYLTPSGKLPRSLSEAHGELLPRGKCFSNAPDLVGEYIARSGLEKELYDLLVDDRHPVITLLGSGGIGKTSLALRVIPILYDETRFENIVWFSSRDVDLLEQGPKPVQAGILSERDIANRYAEMALANEKATAKGFDSQQYFEKQLQQCDLGPTLFVFDNFETTRQPLEVYKWIDTFVRHPNKVLLTTRLRDFRGDYPIEVKGMDSIEAGKLIDLVSGSLGIHGLLTAQYCERLIEESSGHPYIIKILLGEVARRQGIGETARVLASSEDILSALFERTYASISPTARRVFMTLGGWNSAVPRIALEAVLQQSTELRPEVEQGIESLLQYSLAETHVIGEGGVEFIDLPLVARIFAKSKLKVSPAKAAIDGDIQILQMLGPAKSTNAGSNLAASLARFLGRIPKWPTPEAAFNTFEPVAKMICRTYPSVWLTLGQWHMDNDTPPSLAKAREAVESYLEAETDGRDAPQAWRMLADICYQQGDKLGNVHAFVERAQLMEVPFYDLSSTANRLNILFRDQGLPIARDEKTQLASKMAGALERRKTEADATDLSRMAWLAFYLDDLSKAREYVKSGLDLDWTNTHCQNLARKLELV